MTKYVLNSGRVTRYPDRAKKFFEEIFKDTPKECRFLVCLFAMVREDWDSRFQKVQKEYPQLFPEGKSVSFELADPKTFAEQIQRNDVVYIYGGDDHLLLYWLRQFDIRPVAF